ncbi:hypothetical protein PAPHI01_1843 [Pancytospora philotis]|nr:hypothetical protein PAPHI01_1843 [Pancytospora philotis]
MSSKKELFVEYLNVYGTDFTHLLQRADFAEESTASLMEMYREHLGGKLAAVRPGLQESDIALIHKIFRRDGQLVARVDTDGKKRVCELRLDDGRLPFLLKDMEYSLRQQLSYIHELYGAMESAGTIGEEFRRDAGAGQIVDWAALVSRAQTGAEANEKVECCLVNPVPSDALPVAQSGEEVKNDAASMTEQAESNIACKTIEDGIIGDATPALQKEQDSNMKDTERVAHTGVLTEPIAKEESGAFEDACASDKAENAYEQMLDGLGPAPALSAISADPFLDVSSVADDPASCTSVSSIAAIFAALPPRGISDEVESVPIADEVCSPAEITKVKGEVACMENGKRLRVNQEEPAEVSPVLETKPAEVNPVLEEDLFASDGDTNRPQSSTQHTKHKAEVPISHGSLKLHGNKRAAQAHLSRSKLNINTTARCAVPSAPETIEIASAPEAVETAPAGEPPQANPVSCEPQRKPEGKWSLKGSIADYLFFSRFARK